MSRRMTKAERAYWERRALGIPHDAGARIVERIADLPPAPKTVRAPRPGTSAAQVRADLREFGVPDDAGARIMERVADDE